MQNKVKNVLTQIRMYRVVKRSGLFNREYYLRNNLDVAQSCVNPIMHYIRHGWCEGRNPSPLFDTNWYLQQNPDVAKAGINPLYHYLKHGAAEGRDPSAKFSTKNYVSANPEVVQSGINPLTHFLKYSKNEDYYTVDELIIPKSSELEFNVLPRKIAYMVKADKTISSELIKEIHRNIRKKLFSCK